MPIGRTARVHYFCLLEAAQGFGTAALYVQYFAHAAPGWRLLPECTPTAISQARVRLWVNPNPNPNPNRNPNLSHLADLTNPNPNPNPSPNPNPNPNPNPIPNPT